MGFLSFFSHHQGKAAWCLRGKGCGCLKEGEWNWLLISTAYVWVYLGTRLLYRHTHTHTGLLCIYVTILIQWRHVDRHLYCYWSMLVVVWKLSFSDYTFLERFYEQYIFQGGFMSTLNGPYFWSNFSALMNCTSTLIFMTHLTLLPPHSSNSNLSKPIPYSFGLSFLWDENRFVNFNE